MEHNHDTRHKAKYDAYVLDVSQGRKVDRLEVVSLPSSFKKLIELSLTDVIVILIAHGVLTNVKCQADSLSRILHVTSALDYVFGSNIKCSRTVFLLEITTKVSLMIVLPFNDAADLIYKFCSRYALPRLVHCALIGAFERGIAVVVEKTAAGVAGLIFVF